MGKLVTAGAVLKCSFGVAPSTLNVLPAGKPLAKTPAATIMDFIPNTNIMPFGMCMTPSNPQVAAATAAAQGVLTPQPCIPLVTAPWTPGSPKVMIGGIPALNDTSMCMCAWGGVIQISMPGQMQIDIP